MNNSQGSEHKIIMSDDREKDIQALCNAVLSLSIESNGNYGWCPMCYKDCAWNANDVAEIEHEPNCAVLIAKDLKTNIS